MNFDTSIYRNGCVFFNLGISSGELWIHRVISSILSISLPLPSCVFHPSPSTAAFIPTGSKRNLPQTICIPVIQNPRLDTRETEKSRWGEMHQLQEEILFFSIALTYSVNQRHKSCSVNTRLHCGIKRTCWSSLTNLSKQLDGFSHQVSTQSTHGCCAPQGNS